MLLSIESREWSSNRKLKSKLKLVNMKVKIIQSEIHKMKSMIRVTSVFMNSKISLKLLMVMKDLTVP